MSLTKYPFELPPLPYSYDALEPYIDAETMHYHHDKHFAAYIDKLNAALEAYPQLHDTPLDKILQKSAVLPPSSRQAIMRNGGGVYNHTLFFQGLSPTDSGIHSPEGNIANMISRQFGSFEAFKEQFSAEALKVFGSGWTYLAITRERTLRIVNFKNQDTPVEKGMTPVILFDLWEHAYYLKYRNLKSDYVNTLWNIVTFPLIYGI